MNKRYTHHEVRHVLSDGTEVLYNRIQGKSVEDAVSMCLRPLTKREQRESDEIDADNDAAWAEECAREKAASLAQTDLW